jgi:hypothetical protein
MARDAIYLRDVREPTIEIVCEPCGRRGRYNVNPNPIPMVAFMSATQSSGAV